MAVRSRIIADTGVSVTELGFGGAAVGNLYEAVSDREAEEAIAEAYLQGVRYFDTAPFYGYGLSESRLGSVLARFPAESAVVSSKVGRVIELDAKATGAADGFAVDGRRAVFDYSRSGVLRSVDGSLQRLRRDRIDILLLHDVGRATHGRNHERMLTQALDEALPAMAELKAAGVCRAIGIGVNEEDVCLDIMPRFGLDCILLAGRYTLLEQGALDGVMAEAARRGVSIIIGGPFNSGLLADPRAPGSTYDYKPADRRMVERARLIYEVCREENVDVRAVALQFVLAHPAVASVVAGLRTPHEVAGALAGSSETIPASAWNALRKAAVLSAGAPLPSHAMQSSANHP